MSVTRLFKDAATLILAGKATPGAAADRTAWSTSGLTIGTGLVKNGNQLAQFNHDYKLLMLKRSKNMSTLAKAYVFPGGLIDKGDFSSHWWEVFKRRGANSVAEVNDVVNRSARPRPRLLAPETHTWMTGGDPRNCLAPDVALRVAAIRETFEESGILLARPNRIGVDVVIDEPFPVADAVDWQRRVQDDPTELMKLCLSLDCSPDIWSLHAWSDWLTPTFLKPRFDSIFFVATLKSIPPVTYSQTEISNHLWCTPLQFLAMMSQSEVFLPPPQVYEMSRLLNFSEIDLLSQFAKHRDHECLPLYFPIRAHATDGFLHLLPGDDLYDENPDISGLSEALAVNYDKTLEDLETSSKYINRMTFSDEGHWKLTCNVDICGHKKPVTMEGRLPNSKL